MTEMIMSYLVNKKKKDLCLYLVNTKSPTV